MGTIKTVAVILAAGNSTRMGFPKQTALLNGKPVILHTLSAFQQADAIDSILLVARPEDVKPFTQMCKDNGIAKLYAVCEGGATRQQSAENSIAALPADTALIAVQDGARPLVTPTIIDETVAAAKAHGAAAVAVRVKDTIKVASHNGFISATPDRNTLWQVQTPQVFDLVKYKDALASAVAAGVSLTDDCQLFERLGLPVKLVEGNYQNLKITTPEDLTIAAALLGE
ncbi:MAG: 2-C-methyl-D-erythritol 4-phosphate cytidylyltransferase [Clostridia bacterium]|nr:2-C-methyl-D-erythritol 4-phosphate cytidylyltransferase [Clostridia bacterium]